MNKKNNTGQRGKKGEDPKLVQVRLKNEIKNEYIPERTKMPPSYKEKDLTVVLDGSGGTNSTQKLRF